MCVCLCDSFRRSVLLHITLRVALGTVFIDTCYLGHAVIFVLDEL